MKDGKTLGGMTLEEIKEAVRRMPKRTEKDYEIFGEKVRDYYERIGRFRDLLEKAASDEKQE